MIDIFGDDYRIRKFLLDFIYDIRKSTFNRSFGSSANNEASVFNSKNLDILETETHAAILEINDIKILDKETPFK